MIAKATDYATRSAAAGGFDAKEARLSTDALKLDQKGWNALAQESKKWLAKVEQIKAEAADRLADDYSSALNVGFTLMLFQARPFSADFPEGKNGDGGGEAAREPVKAG